MTKLRFLLLEDNPADVELVSTTLENSDLDCDFFVVETREDFQQALQTQSFDIVLSDYSLPAFDGMEAIEIVCTQFPEIPCILVSGVLGEERAIEALRCGAANYVLKQRLERLVPAVKQALKEAHERNLFARAIAELRKNEALFRTSVEAMADCLVILSVVRDAQGVIQDFVVEYINEMAKRYLFVSPDEQVGKSFYSLVPSFKDIENTYLFSEFCFVVENGRLYKDEICLKGYQRNDKTVADQFVAIEMRAARLDSGLVVTWRDITQRKMLEQEHLQQLKEAEAARNQAMLENQRKGDFLARFSHELRSPISNISGWLQLLDTNRQSVELEDRVLEVIQRNAKLLERLASDLLDGSRIERGKFRCDLEPLGLDRLNQIGTQAIDAVRLINHDKYIPIIFEPSSLSGQIFGDADRLQQMIQNLLANAIEFTPAHGKIALEINQQDDKALIISVTDTGKGMSSNVIAHVFDQIWQVEHGFNRNKSGVGLGIPIVKYIVDAHGGQITAKSGGINQGSTFTIELPLHTAISQHATALPNSSVPSIGQQTTAQRSLADSSPTDSSASDLNIDRTIKLSLKNVRVLVVDDQADSLEVCKMMLETHGAEVEGTTSAAEAIKTVRQFRPHVIVSDIAMPEKDGYGMIRRIREFPELEGGLTPAIALSAYTSELDRTRALLAGFQIHIAKPVNFKDIIGSVASLSSQFEPAEVKDI